MAAKKSKENKEKK